MFSDKYHISVVWRNYSDVIGKAGPYLIQALRINQRSLATCVWSTDLRNLKEALVPVFKRFD